MKKILFLNDWGTNPNERIIYIADYFFEGSKIQVEL